MVSNSKLSKLAGRMRISGKSLSNLKGSTESSGNVTMDMVNNYKAYKFTKYLFLLLFIGLFFVLMGVGLGVGAYSISFTEVYRVIFNDLFDLGWTVNSVDHSVVWDNRMPRILTAAFVGIGLAVAGAAMQSMMKNPLADPYTTGISSGAAFGATLAMTLGVAIVAGTGGAVMNAFIFAMVPAIVILALSRFRKPSPSMMILCGISIMYIFNAVQSYLMLVADPNAAAQVYTWTVGNITSSNWDDLKVIVIVAICGVLAIQWLTRSLNAMNSGDAYAKSLGINVDRVRMLTLMVVSVLAAGIVCFTGIIGFIGLVAPHIARIFIGSDNKLLVPASALMGACLMILADIIAHMLSSYELPVGIVTAMIGGPIFMILILKQKKEVW